MSKEIVSHLHELEVSDFLHEIFPAQAETILGGDTNVDLSTVHDGINNNSTTFSDLIGIENNRLFSFDFSRFTMNLVIMLSDGESRVFRLLM